MEEPAIRVGIGFDAHRFGGAGPVVLCGVIVDDGRGLEGTSDADVPLHALGDALLGAVALGDLGVHFPSDDPMWQGADSLGLLAEIVRQVTVAGYHVGNVDVTIVAQTVRIAPHRDEMQSHVASVLGVADTAVSIKATTTDGMGFLGRDEGIAAFAVATVVAQP